MQVINVSTGFKFENVFAERLIDQTTTWCTWIQVSFTEPGTTVVGRKHKSKASLFSRSIYSFGTHMKEANKAGYVLIAIFCCCPLNKFNTSCVNETTWLQLIFFVSRERIAHWVPEANPLQKKHRESPSTAVGMFILLYNWARLLVVPYTFSSFKFGGVLNVTHSSGHLGTRNSPKIGSANTAPWDTHVTHSKLNL